jgi:hypothetical protein
VDAAIVAGALSPWSDQSGCRLLSQALAVDPLDEHLRQNAIDVSRMLIQDGQSQRCDARQPWGELAN